MSSDSDDESDLESNSGYTACCGVCMPSKPKKALTEEEINEWGDTVDDAGYVVSRGDGGAYSFVYCETFIQYVLVGLAGMCALWLGWLLLLEIAVIPRDVIVQTRNALTAANSYTNSIAQAPEASRYVQKVAGPAPLSACGGTGLDCL